MRRAATALALAWATLAGAQQAPTDGVKFSGYFKAMPVASETTLGGSERYTADLNRLRLEWKGPLAPYAAMELQYDNEVLLGDYVQTREYALRQAQPRRTWWDLESVYVREDNLVGQHRIRRAAITLSRGSTDLRVGRQRVAWGTGRFWSPLDLLNPVDPVSLEPGEREGVDAIVLEHKRSAVSRTTLVYAPVHDAPDYMLAQWHGNASGTDFSLTGGRVPEGKMVGLDLAGQLGGAGLRAEWTITRQDAGGTPRRLLLGWDYAFANTLTLSAELYYDGSGSRDPAHYDVAGLLAGRRQSVATRYAGLYARYELTPLLKAESWFVRNFDDRSWYESPRLTYSVRQNVDLALGAQFFGGSMSSEFGQRKTLWFAYAQWFF